MLCLDLYYVFLILATGKLIDISIGSLGQLIVASQWYNYTLLFSIITSVIGIVSGYHMTSHYGIIGSAFAISITVLISDIFQIILGYLKLKILPFDSNIIKIFILSIIIFLFCYIFDMIELNIYISSILKISFVTIIFFGSIYIFNINEETNKLTSRFLTKIGLKV